MTSTFTSPDGEISYIDSSKAAGLLLWIIQDPQVYVELQEFYRKHGQASIAYLMEHADTLDLDDIDHDFDQKFGAASYFWEGALEDLEYRLIERGELTVPKGVDDPYCDSLAFESLDALWAAIEDDWVALKVAKLWVIVQRS